MVRYMKGKGTNENRRTQRVDNNGMQMSNDPANHNSDDRRPISQSYLDIIDGPYYSRNINTSTDSTENETV